MKRVAIIAFTEFGAALGLRLLNAFREEGMEVTGYLPERHAHEEYEAFTELPALVGQLWHRVDALCFIGACGIAVRGIAPYVKSKLQDPAVVVSDETGRFVISLLSGHVGGANALAERAAAAIGATPVITTASDSHALLDGAAQPQNLVLGIGCRRGLSAEAIERATTILLWDFKIPLARVIKVGTIDIKRDEEGLVAFAKAHRLPLHFFTAGELAAVKDEVSHSERVLQAVGVDNVCERAAILCGGKGRLVLKKASRDGVTVAAFERE